MQICFQKFNIPCNYIYQTKNYNQIRLSPPLYSDVVCFTGHKIQLLDLPKDEVLKLVKQSINLKNGLGIGGEADVYEISDTDYCIRLIGLNGDSRHFATRYKDYTTDFSKDLTPQEKVNHTVIRLGNGASIMRKIDGEPVYSFLRTPEEQLSVAKEVAKFPIEAFSGLLRQIAVAPKVGLEFDPHAGNVIANFKNKTLTAIDFQDYFGRSSAIPLSAMLNGLKSVDNDEVNLNLLKKVLKAGLEEFKPGVKPCFDVDCFDFNRLLRSHFFGDDTNFYRLSYLKSLEMNGRNVGEELQQLIESFSVKFDNLVIK